MLSFKESIAVWSRVYFYTIFGTAASFLMFSRYLPLRAYLINLQKARTDTAATTAKTTDEANTSLNAGKVERVARDEAHARFQHAVGDDDVDSALLGSGLSADPGKDVEQIVAEVRRDIEERKRRGSLVQGFDVRKAVDEKIKQMKGQMKKGGK